jgi:hypothetical protein
MSAINIEIRQIWVKLYQINMTKGNELDETYTFSIFDGLFFKKTLLVMASFRSLLFLVKIVSKYCFLILYQKHISPTFTSYHNF